MLFCDKLIQLRKEKGYSQEQLGGILHLSRQAVSKWEGGQSMPDLDKLIQISDLFQVSLDYLIRAEVEEREQKTAPPNLLPPTGVEKEEFLSMKTQLDHISTYMDCNASTGYEYKSKCRLFGLPLVHIHFSRRKNFSGQKPLVAKGIIALGDISIGVFSLGLLSFGIVGIGAASVGLLAVGGIALGGLAIGGASIGVLAFGGAAFGIYAIGGAAFASQVAIGGAAASAHVAIGDMASGAYTLPIQNTTTSKQIYDFLVLHCPNLWKPLLSLFSMIGH